MNYVITEQTMIRDIIESIERAGASDLELSYQDNSYLKRYPYHVDILKRILASMGRDVHIHLTEPMQVPVAVPVQQMVPVRDLKVSETQSSVNAGEKKKKQRVAFGASPRKLLIVVFVLALFGVLGGGVYAYYYLPRATVTLQVAEKVFERTLGVTAKTTVSLADNATNTIPATVVSVEVQASENFPSTGKKTIGEKATGVVEMKNFTTSAIRLNEGATLTSQADSSLQFIVTEGATVPKATITQPSDDTKVLEAGIIQVGVEAVEIGEMYNLSANTRFTLNGYEVSDVYGVNEPPLSGGLTKEVTVVSADDHNRASDQLRAKLKADAPAEIDKQISGTKKYKSGTIAYTTKSETYSEDVGDEANVFSLTTKQTVSVLVYDHNDVAQLLQVLVADAVPEGYELSSADDPVGVDSVEVVDAETLKLQTRISALVVPIINTYEISQQLLGKRPSEADQILKSIPAINGYSVTLWPTLPDILKSFPHIEERLTVQVEVVE